MEAAPMKMRTNWILSAVIVVLLGYIGLTEWRSRQLPQEESETLGMFDPAKVDEVTFTVDGQTVSAVREADGRWSVTHPFRDEADGPTILSILANVREQKVIRTLDAPDNLEQYGLTRARAITVRERRPFGSTLHTYYLGEISPVHYVCPLDYWMYAQRQGEPRILIIEGYQLNQLLPHEPADLRNQNLLSFNPHDIRKIGVTLGSTSYTAVKTPEGWMTEGRERAPFTYMQEILFTLANLRAVRAEVQGDADLATLGLGQPLARLVLYTDQPEPVEAMSFGAHYGDQGAVYVRRESTRSVYLVSSYILDELRRPALAPDSARGQ
jgi:hypothetical protein